MCPLCALQDKRAASLLLGRRALFLAGEASSEQTVCEDAVVGRPAVFCTCAIVARIYEEKYFYALYLPTGHFTRSS